jgi:SAM-dependent methyltransferase
MLPEQMQATRCELSERYLEGSGIEIGALHEPLRTSERATVRYVDRLDVAGLRQHYPELAGEDLVNADLIEDGDVLASIEDGQLDFIIANHMLEHTENPIGTIRNHLRKLRDNGVLYHAVPDKWLCFDCDRRITPFEHLVRDDRGGPMVSRLEHFYEWVRVKEKVVEPDEVERRVQHLMSINYRIYFHVWDENQWRSFLEDVNLYLDSSFRIEHFGKNYGWVIAILRNVARTHEGGGRGDSTDKTSG